MVIVYTKYFAVRNVVHTLEKVELYKDMYIVNGTILLTMSMTGQAAMVECSTVSTLSRETTVQQSRAMSIIFAGSYSCIFNNRHMLSLSA